MPHDFFEIYDEFQQQDVSVNFSSIYEEWKRRTHIRFVPSPPPLSQVRSVPRVRTFQSCDGVYDGTAILPGIFVVWFLRRRCIHWWYEPSPPEGTGLWDSMFASVDDDISEQAHQGQQSGQRRGLPDSQGAITDHL